MTIVTNDFLCLDRTYDENDSTASTEKKIKSETKNSRVPNILLSKESRVFASFSSFTKVVKNADVMTLKSTDDKADIQSSFATSLTFILCSINSIERFLVLTVVLL